jgi:hypothetical protein
MNTGLFSINGGAVNSSILGMKARSFQEKISNILDIM